MPAIDWYEAACLAAAVLGEPEPEDDDSDHIDPIEDKLVDQYGMDLDQFSRLAGKLLPMCAQDVGTLSNRVRRGFVKDGRYIARTYDLDFGDVKISDLINPTNVS